MGPGREAMNGEGVEQVAAELGVAPQTLAQIKTLIYNANKEAIDLRADLQRAHLDLGQQLDQDKPDAKKIMQTADQIGAAESKLRKNRLQLLLSVRDLLTPEQRTKLQQILSQRHGMGPRPGGPGWQDGGPHAP